MIAQAMDTRTIVQIIKALQDDPRVTPDDLFRIEWAYLPLLDEYRGASSKLLWGRLSSDPAFYCEIIRLVFRSQDCDLPVEEITEQSQGIATNVYRLLSEWRRPPGSRDDGGYDASTLDAWMQAMKAEASASGRLKIAMIMVGHVLTYVPRDPDGLWIHRGAAEVLNAKDAPDLREGFRSELLNSRGMHWVDPSGKPEQELAEKYRTQAEMLEDTGFHRLATIMRDLATSYERDAERVRAEHRSDA